MKIRISILLLSLFAFLAPAQGLKYSQYPETNTLHDGFLLLVADPGKTNYSISWLDLRGQITTLGNFTTTNINVTYITNFYGYITNLFSTTEYVTNIFVLSLTNAGVATNSAVITDANHVETNAVNVHGVFTNTASGPPSFGLLQNTELKNSTVNFSGTANQISGGGSTALGASATVFALTDPVLFPGKVRVSGLTNTSNTLLQGTETNSSMAAGFILSDSLGGRSASFNELNMTNSGYALPTNNVGGAAFVFGGPGTAATLYDTNISAATTLKLFDVTACGSTAGGLKIYVTCSGGTDRILTFPAGCSGAGLGTPPAVTITNAKAAFFDVIYKPGATPVTNVFWSPVY